MFHRVATGQGKVREIQGQGKVREFWKKSGKFRILEKVMEICHWSGKFRGLKDILFMQMTQYREVVQEYDFCIICGIHFLGVLAGFQRDVMFIHACISPVLYIANRQSWLILGNSVFTGLKISVESLKSQGNSTSSTSGNPVSTNTQFRSVR